MLVLDIMMMVVMDNRVHHCSHCRDHNHDHLFQQYDLEKQRMTMVMMKTIVEIDECQWNGRWM